MKKHNIFKLGVSHIDVMVGSLADNKDNLIKEINKSKSYITITPYMALPSIGSLKLVEKWYFIRDQFIALNQIIRGVTYKGIYTLTIPLNVNNQLFVGTLVIKNKNVLAVIPQSTYLGEYKQYLKEPVNFGNTIFKDTPFGHLIFKDGDLRFTFIMGDDNKNYEEITKKYIKNGVNFIIDISSDFKTLENKDLAYNKAMTYSSIKKIAYLYSSPSNTETMSKNIYTKDTFLFNSGKLINKENYNNSNAFIADLDVDYLISKRINNVSVESETHDIELKTKDSTSYDALTLSKNPFIQHNSDIYDLIEMQKLSLAKKILSMPDNMQKVIIGISGGLDSALALLATYNTFKYLKKNTKDIITVIMPSKETSKKSLDNARKLTSLMNTTVLEFSIDDEIKVTRETLKNDKKDTTYENIQARIRTMMLLNISNQYQGFVLGTGDLSEIALGYVTFGGDNISMFNINSSIPKTLVQDMTKYYLENIYPDFLVLGDILKQKISAELNENQVTEDVVGKYEINDFILYHALISNWSKDKITYFIENIFKLSKEDSKLYTNRFFKLFLKNQFKIKQMAECANMTGILLGETGTFSLPADSNAK